MMKSIWVFRIWAVVMISLNFSISQGADKFYYGSYGGKDYPSILKDSLRFNIVENIGINASNIQSLAACTLRAIVHAEGTDNPTDWAWNSHYTLWEAEGYPGSYYKLTYNGGSWADGGKARYFDNLKNPPDTAGFIQTGPGYYQERKDANGHDIQYIAEFRLKSPLYFPSAKSGSSPAKLCRLMVVGNGQVLGDSTVYGKEFNNTIGYKSYNVTYKATQNPIEFKIYWYGNRQLYIDYVKVYDRWGYDLIDNPNHAAANNIKTYVSQAWVHTTIPGTNDTVVYRWYGRDEPPSIDLYTPHAYIDSLLGIVSQERVLFQAYGGYWNPEAVHDYMLRENPKDYCIDPCPTSMFGNNYTGSFYQEKWNTYIDWLNRSKIVADSLNKDFWVTIQAQIVASSKDSAVRNCTIPLIWFNQKQYCPQFREPTSEELRLQTFLSLCYGADAILHYQYGFRDLGDSLMETGLYDGLYGHDFKTYKWREIKNFIGPRVEKLGPIFNQLTWQGACFGDSVGGFNLRNGPHSYIDSVVGRQHDSTYVQVGFFEHIDTSYFMLVNRKCLEGEDETLKVYFDIPNGPYLLRDMYTEEPSTGGYPSLISLKPGEGRLFRIEP